MQIRTRIKTGNPETLFDKGLEQELLSYTLQLANLLNGGILFSDNFDAEFITIADTGAANSANSVSHTLKRIPSGFLVTKINVGGVVYDGGVAWTTTTLSIKCSAANAAVTLLVF